jgi:hypothetical protein
MSVVHLLGLPNWFPLGRIIWSRIVASNQKTLTGTTAQSRLVLKDAQAGEEVRMPQLRLTTELTAVTESGLDRDTAEQTWQALQLKPQDVIAQKLQLTAANTKLQQASKQANLASAELVELQSKIQHLQTNRFQHPVVYAAGAAIAGFAWLWLSERKKRIASQEQTTALLSDADSVVAISEGSAYAELQQAEHHSQKVAPVLSISDQAVHTSQPQDMAAHSAASEIQLVPVIDDYLSNEEAFLGSQHKPTPWWKRLGRKKNYNDDSYNVSPPPSTNYLATENFASQFTVIDPYESNLLVDSKLAAQENDYDPDAANVALLTQTRVKPTSSADGMAHLLEIRMAVQALTVLEKPYAAQKLLQEHIDAVPKTCAWAYMQYLDSAFQLGQRDAYEAMRKSYRLQFNRLAPYWGEPNASVQSLDQYDRPMAELCAVWDDKERAKTLISTWLLGTLHSRRLFQLPAYLDLMDLFEMLEFYEENSRAAQDFVPTVSLLDLDYEFAVEVTIDQQPEQDALRAIPAIKTGDFAVDFNLAQSATQYSALTASTDAPKAQSAN